ncbi:MAG: DUF4824 family protein [Acidobacteria bacterium]|nr:DUF4824 family protein [Acidobacteriota bacterium]
MKPRALSLAAAALAIALPLVVMWRVNANRQAITSSIVLTERELLLDTGNRNQSALYLTFLMSGPPEAALSRRARELGFTRENQKPRRGFAVFELRDQISPPSAALASPPPGSPQAGPFPPPRWPGVRELVSRLTPVDAGPDPHRLRQQWPQPNRYLIVPVMIVGHLVTDSSTANVVWQMHIIWINSRLQVPAEWRGLFLSLPKVAPSAERPAFRAHIRFGANYEPWLESAWLPAPAPVNPAPPPLSQQNTR